MSESSPCFKPTSQRKKSSTPLGLSGLRKCHSHNCLKSCVATLSILILALSLLFCTSPYHRSSLRRFASFLWRVPMREIDSHFPSEDKNTPSISCHLANSPSNSLTNPPADLPAVLRDYAAWHKKQRACLVNPQCKKKPKLLVLRCPRHPYCLGLGDRMRGVLFSIFYAIVMKRLYIIAWHANPFPLRVALAPASIDWTPPEGWSLKNHWPYLRLLYCRGGPGCNWRQPELTQIDNINLNDSGINFYSDDLEERLGHYDVITVTPGISRRYYDKRRYMKDIFSGLNDTKEDMASMEKAVYRTLFKPSKSVAKKMKSVTFGAKNPYYGVQIRTGIDVNETHEERFGYINSHLETTIRNILDCLEFAGGKTRLGRIYLAADSTMVKDLFVAKAQQRGFDVKLFREEIIHYVKVKFRKDQAFNDDLLCDRFLTVFADLFMMSRSRILVSTGSHFADFAHALSGNRNSTHILYRPELGGVPREVCKPFNEIV